jgi:hypothetical protein
LADADYAKSVNRIREQARVIVELDSVRGFPTPIRALFEGSAITRGLPGSIGKTLLVGFPDDEKSHGISSGELRIYREEASAAVASLTQYADLADRLRIQPYIVPDDKVGLELELPRSASTMSSAN